MPFPQRVFRLIAKLYPREFRERFGDDLTSTYADARADARSRGTRGVAAFWTGVAGDALFRAPGEHLHTTARDTRFAIRRLVRAPLFTAIALLTLALGIGANTAVFSVVYAIAISPIGYEDSARLVRIWEKNDTLGIPEFATSVLNYLSWREQARSFEDIAAWRFGSVTMTGAGEPQRLPRIEATASLLPVLRVRPVLGRNFVPAEMRPGGPRAAMLAESIWQRQFGGDRTVVGRSVSLDGIPHEIVAVVRDRDLTSPVQVITPLAPDVTKESRSNHMTSTIGRLRPGVTMQQAQREMDDIARRLGVEFPESNRQWGVSIVSFYDWVVPSAIRNGLYVLLGSAALVLLIGCSNLANLMLARASARRREIAVRIALGASRTNIAREMLTESVLLALVGGASGLIVAIRLTPVLQRALGDALPRADEIAVNTPVLIFSLVVSILTGVLFGMVPAAFGTRDVAEALKEAGRGSSGGQHGGARRLLVAGQVALATALTLGAALLVQSYQRLLGVDLGFNPDRITTAMTGLPPTRYPGMDVATQFYDRLITSIRALPGIESAALTSGAPYSGGNTSMSVRAVGSGAMTSAEMQADWRIVSDDYFKTLQIPIRRGRTFDRREFGEKGLRSMIISETLSRRLFGSGDPIGHELKLGNNQIFRVVGVAGDARTLALGTDPRPAMYFSTGGLLWPVMTIVVRARTGIPVAAEIRDGVAAMDPLLAVFNVRTMDAMIAASAAQPRITAWLVGGFAFLALLLASIGVYGTLAYLVAQRTQEIGVRIALGSTEAGVIRLVVRQALRLSAAGAMVGTAAALVAGPVIRSQLFGVSPRDVGTFVLVPIALVLMAIVASYVPARRATRIDPLSALRGG